MGESEFAEQFNQFIFIKLTQNETQHLRAIQNKTNSTHFLLVRNLS